MTDTVATIAQTDPLSLDLGERRAKATATTPDVREADTAIWTDPTRGTEAGFWECTPGTFPARRDGYTEICQFLSGAVRIEVDGEEPVLLGPGDTLVMPSGWVGTWHVLETVRKLYVTVPDA
ncbi:MAG: hypothetical protein JWP66_164 [Naasia sp.]|nr:hypothetical protein [Naasia sp.]